MSELTSEVRAVQDAEPGSVGLTSDDLGLATTSSFGRVGVRARSPRDTIGLEPGALHMRPRCETRVTLGSAPSGRLRSTNLRTIGGRRSLASVAHSSLTAVIRTNLPTSPLTRCLPARPKIESGSNSAFWACRELVPHPSRERPETSRNGGRRTGREGLTSTNLRASHEFIDQRHARDVNGSRS
jgi:hypothetical protein